MYLQALISKHIYGLIFLSLCVDDMIISTYVDKMDGLKLQLVKKFEMKNLGIVPYFLGFKVSYFAIDYFIFQYNYIANILEQTHIFLY